MFDSVLSFRQVKHNFFKLIIFEKKGGAVFVGLTKYVLTVWGSFQSKEVTISFQK